MARRSKSDTGGESIQGYFRVVFKENPRLLKVRSNQELFDRWLKDHPGESVVPDNVKTGLSNLKSVMRRKLGIRRKRRAMAEAGATEAHVVRTGPGRRPGSLGLLEGRIDDALALARQLDPEGLDDIIRLLRGARNRVILRSGEP
jgi:hypothetical protein